MAIGLDTDITRTYQITDTDGVHNDATHSVISGSRAIQMGPIRE